MTTDGPEKASGVLVTQHLMRPGIEVKLDKGFAEGTYCVHVEFDELASRWGFATARRTAGAYCGQLKQHLDRSSEYELGRTKDGSRTGDPRRKHDLESTFLWFTIKTGDGQFQDEAMRESFTIASMRAGQAWDQELAKEQTRRRDARQEKFRQQLASLLDGPAYARMDAATKERLLHEVPALAFPARGRER